MEITAFTIWYIIGITGFLYWWGGDMKTIQQDNNMSAGVLFLIAVLIGFFGVFTWLFGYLNNKS